MVSNRKSTLTKNHIAQIEAEVKQAAIDHLHAQDAETALSHFTDNVIAVSNTQLFRNLEALSEDIKAYYDILKEVNHAVWDEMHINVINKDTAVLTAKFFYSFTDTNDEKTDLQGVWTAVYVRKDDGWKICTRHESFDAIDNRNS
jgi:ketosteroid isomerase-like protein